MKWDTKDVEVIRKRIILCKTIYNAKEEKPFFGGGWSAVAIPATFS